MAEIADLARLGAYRASLSATKTDRLVLVVILMSPRMWAAYLAANVEARRELRRSMAAGSAVEWLKAASLQTTCNLRRLLPAAGKQLR
jgi:hypothetical protein